MPTPPTGDIACAASPINSNPSVYQRRSRFSCTSSNFTSSNEVTSGSRPASQGTSDATRRCIASMPSALSRASLPLGMTKAHWK